MQCSTMNRRTLTMNWDGLGNINNDDDHFFESYERISSAVSTDLASSGSDDDDDYEDGRMSFASAMSSASLKSIHPIDSIAKNSQNMFGGYEMWMAEPGDINERRKRLFQDMGFSSNKSLLRIASSAKPPDESEASSLASSVVSSPEHQEPKMEEESRLTPIFVRSRSDSDIDAFSVKERKEALVGPVSKQRLTKTLSGQLVPSIGVSSQYKGGVKKSEKKSSMKSSELLVSHDALSSFFLIKNLDTGKEFIVKEYNEEGMWNKLSDVQTGKQLTLEEFEKSVGYSPVVKELMRRKQVARNIIDERKLHQNSLLTKSFRNSKRMGAAFLKNIATSVSGLIVDKDQEHSSPEAHKSSRNSTSQWVKARQYGKSYKEITALHMSQEIQAHEGAIWTIRFSVDGRFLASAGEDKVIHVWEVQEYDVLPTRTGDDFSGGKISEHPPLAEIMPMPSEKRRKGKHRKKGDSIPDYVNVPENVFGLSEKPSCTFKGHQDDILDLSWSRSQTLLSSSMDKTVRMWDLETRTCLKMFAHNDYVTCIQFNPVDDDYFISGSLDGKVRIWSIPDRQVVDWTDIHEMVTAASYTPDGQGALIGSHQGNCRMYTIEDSKLELQMDIPIKSKSQVKKIPGFQSPARTQAQAEKVTGLEFSPSNPSEVLITSANSRIRIYNESELVQKFRGFRNTSSQISASFSTDGKHIISASEDSQVYIWKVEDPKPTNNGKAKSKASIQANEHFHCKDVSVAIPWPGSTRIEPPIVEIHSKRHSKRLVAPLPQTTGSSLTREDNLVNGHSKRHLPPLPKKNNVLERTTSVQDDDFAHSARIDPGIGVTESFRSSSPNIGYGDSSSQSWSASWSLFDNNTNGHTVQATAWGMVIVAASLEGQIRVYQNFGLPVKVSRQAHLF